MKLAFLAQPFDRLTPPVQDGSLALWIYQVARQCANRGHEAIVFANHGASLRSTTTQHDGVEYVFTATRLNGLTNRLGRCLAATGALLRRPSRLPEFAQGWMDVPYAAQVARRLKQRRVDAILVMNYSQFVPVLKRIYPDCRVYLYMQCEWLTQLDAVAMEERIAAADMVGGCSEYITRTIVERFPQHADKCVTLTNAGVPPSTVTAEKRESFRLLFLGRVSPEKGVHDLIAAFHKVLVKFPDARLDIVGGYGSAPLEFLVGLSQDPRVVALRHFYTTVRQDDARDPYLAHLEQAAGSELGRSIVFHGRLDHARITEAFQRASLLVNPSLSESFGMTLVEALMHGIPVVATRIGGMPFIVDDGETGVLVDAADSGLLADAICDLLRDPVRMRAMGQLGAARVSARFTWTHTAATLIDQFSFLTTRGRLSN